MGRLLRQKREEHELSLAAASDRLAERGHRIPPSTLARIELGELDPGVRRLHLLLALYRIPPHLISDLVEMETIAGDRRIDVTPGNLQALHDRGIEHWRNGNVADGLAHLMAVREYVPEGDAARLLRQRSTLAFATAARNLGKYRLAQQMVDELLCEPPDPELAVPTLVLGASVWRGLGSLDAALGLIHRAEARLDPEDSRQQAWVLHQKAKLLLEDRKPEEADRVLARALAVYRRRGDTYGETRALNLKIFIQEARDDLAQAQEAARRMIQLAARKKHARTEAYGHLELGRLLVKDGNLEMGTDQLTQGLAEAVRIKDTNAQFLAHYHLWKAHLRAKDRDRAQLEFTAATYFGQFVDERTHEVEEIERLNRRRESHAPAKS